MELNAQDPYLHYTFGELYQRLGQNQRANEYYANVTKVDPDFPKPYLEQAGRCAPYAEERAAHPPNVYKVVTQHVFGPQTPHRRKHEMQPKAVLVLAGGVKS